MAQMVYQSLQEGDPTFEPCSDDEDEESGEIKFEVADANALAPLPIEAFVDEIDTRHGFYQGMAEFIDDFEKELKQADETRNNELQALQQHLARVK